MLKFNQLATKAKITAGGLVLATVIVGAGFSNIGLVKSAQSFWVQNGQTVQPASSELSVSAGGSAVKGVKQSFTSATTTPCSIQNGNATTSLAYFSMQITTGTSTASTFDVSTSTTAFATSSTLVSSHAVGSGAQTTLSWFASGAQNAIVAPNEWVIFKTNEAGLGGYTYTGTCSVDFITP